MASADSRENAELVPKFHNSLLASHAALPMRTSQLHQNYNGMKIQDSSVGIATGYRLRAGRSEFNFWQGQETFLYSTVSRLGLGPTHPHIQWVPRHLP
jgi:hypothetical protein